MVRPQQPILRRPESWVTCGILLRPICGVFTRRLQLGAVQRAGVALPVGGAMVADNVRHLQLGAGHA